MLQGVYFATGFLHYLVAPHASWSREPALREGVLREAARGGERLARLLAGRHARTAQAAAGVLWLLASDDEMGGGSTMQMWRVSDLVYRPKEDCLAEIEGFRKQVDEELQTMAV